MLQKPGCLPPQDPQATLRDPRAPNFNFFILRDLGSIERPMVRICPTSVNLKAHNTKEPMNSAEKARSVRL